MKERLDEPEREEHVCEECGDSFYTTAFYIGPDICEDCEEEE